MMKRLLTFALTMMMLSVTLATSAFAGYNIGIKPEGTLQIKELTVAVEAGDSISSVKEKVTEETGIAAQFVNLFFDEIELEDDHTLADYNVQSGDILELTTDSAKITLELYGGELAEGAINPVEVPVGATILDKLPAVTRFACDLTGWSYSDDSRVTNTDICTGDMTLTAGWRAAFYTVKFDTNGSADTFADWKVNYNWQYKEYGAEGKMPEPTRENYTFGGWYLGETLITAESRVDIAEDHTLVAKWTVNPCTVTFDAGNGTVDPAAKTVTFDAAYGELPVPTAPEGYVFDYWKLGESEVNAETKVATIGDHTLTAVYLAKVEYQITVGANQTVNEGSDASFTSNAEHMYFEKVQVDGKDVAAENYSHAAGSTVVTLKKEFLETLSFGKHTLDIVSKNGTASTEFTLKQIYFTAKFDLNYNTNTAAPASITVEQGKAYNTHGTLPTVSRTGYVFDGWYTAKKGGTEVEADAEFSADADVTLYAQWTAKKYVVDFDVNGGTSSDPADISVTFGEKYGTLPTPKYTGKYFAGWYTAKTGGSKITANTVVNLAPANNVIDLYAHWSNVPVTGDDTSAAEIALLCGALALSLVGLAGVGVVVYKKRKE